MKWSSPRPCQTARGEFLRQTAQELLANVCANPTARDAQLTEFATANDIEPDWLLTTVVGDRLTRLGLLIDMAECHQIDRARLAAATREFKWDLLTRCLQLEDSHQALGLGPLPPLLLPEPPPS